MQQCVPRCTPELLGDGFSDPDSPQARRGAKRHLARAGPARLDARGGRARGTNARTCATKGSKRLPRCSGTASTRTTNVARATTPHEFVVPPAKAEEMYDPETFGRSAGDRVIVY
jgi:hypothetical protein